MRAIERRICILSNLKEPSRARERLRKGSVLKRFDRIKEKGCFLKKCYVIERCDLAFVCGAFKTGSPSLEAFGVEKKNLKNEQLARWRLERPTRRDGLRFARSE